MEIKSTNLAFTTRSATKAVFAVAKSYCETRGMKLPMFRTQEEYTAITSYAGKKKCIGLQSHWFGSF